MGDAAWYLGLFEPPEQKRVFRHPENPGHGPRAKNSVHLELPARLRRARSIFVPGLAAPAPAAFSLRLTFSRILLTVKHSCSLAREGFEGPEIV
jgi:hypothetical protein